MRVVVVSNFEKFILLTQNLGTFSLQASHNSNQTLLLLLIDHILSCHQITLHNLVTNASTKLFVNGVDVFFVHFQTLLDRDLSHLEFTGFFLRQRI